jgi:hypothetical protein
MQMLHCSTCDAMDMNATPVPTRATEGTASIKLIGIAEKAATTEPEALEPRAELQKVLRSEACYK